MIHTRVARTGLIALIGLGIACTDRTPVAIKVNGPTMIVKKIRIPVGAVVVNESGEVLNDLRMSYSVAPAEILQVEKDGSMLCRMTGDATIEISGGGLVTQHHVKCRIPTRIVMPERDHLLLGEAPVTMVPRVMGEGGRPLTDVPVTMTSSDPSILKTENGTVIPVAIGKAVLKASVGGVVAVAPIEVIEKVVGGSLRLEDGKSRSWTLQEGTFRIKIDVLPSHAVDHGVTASWEGSSCETQPEQQSHRFLCSVPGTATLTITNPSGYGLGVPVTGNMTVYRVAGD